MRKVIVLTFVSLDGVMQAPGGPKEDISGGFKYGGWTAPYFDDFSGKVMGEQMSKPPSSCCWAELPLKSLRNTGPTTVPVGLVSIKRKSMSSRTGK